MQLLPILTALALTCVSAPTLAQRTAPRPVPPPRPVRPPNVVLLVADDLGYRDLGVQGMRDIATPNIDRLAREGVRFTDGYMVSSLCSPSRAGILTGRYPERWGQELNPGRTVPSDSAFGIPQSQPLLSERLKSLGYATGIFGKWHEGYRPANLPMARGFDDFVGFLGPAQAYRQGWIPFRYSKLQRGTQLVRERSFLTDAFAREAVRFIDQRAAHPFFLYVPFNAVHEPMIDDEARIKRVSSIQDPKRRRYASILIGMDDAVGQILGALDRHGLTDNTLVFFVSDNGGPTQVTTSSNAPLRGVKGNLYEGGIRVPFIVRWPGRVPAGARYSLPVSALDVAATTVAAVGGPCCADFDGVDLLPFIRGERGAAVPHQRLFWRMDQEVAVRDGQWKLVSMAGNASLYDLQTDIAEAKDVAQLHPDIVQRLTRASGEWASQMQPPKWGLANFRRRRGTSDEH